MKGMAGKKTGAATRKAINAKVKSGLTLDEIGNKVNRDGSTIGNIASGNIKNPPKDLASKVRAIKAKKKPAAKKHSKK